MFSHVFLGTNDIERSKQFYDETFKQLGHKPGMMDPSGRCLYMTPSGLFGLTTPINGEPASVGNGQTIGFIATSEEQVKQWHQAGLAHGGVAIESAPGLRQKGDIQLFMAYLRDPDGNKICATYPMS
ncbi:VOC family protein [Motilimonas pumila]|uniref:VOC family protein n=1 Tax=Motilimonas pumila TaxID=2303987 RepID=A0A418YD01_9GAMM|nr:VOC family protein [Motilimonas pumila]RJG42394.1 VOC family protein [Motilimonas pumila]